MFSLPVSYPFICLFYLITKILRLLRVPAAQYVSNSSLLLLPSVAHNCSIMDLLPQHKMPLLPSTGRIAFLCCNSTKLGNHILTHSHTHNNVKSVAAFVSDDTKRFVFAAYLPTEACVLCLPCVCVYCVNLSVLFLCAALFACKCI